MCIACSGVFRYFGCFKSSNDAESEEKRIQHQTHLTPTRPPGRVPASAHSTTWSSACLSSLDHYSTNLVECLPQLTRSPLGRVPSASHSITTSPLGQVSSASHSITTPSPGRVSSANHSTTTRPTWSSVCFIPLDHHSITTRPP